jgi:SAM-dependent methyltransferase
MSKNRDDKLVDEHYGRSDLAAKILEALRAAGKDPDALTLEDLAPIDQLHARGAQATRQLARLASITTVMRVLDVGGGLGDPARTLASEFGCTVEVLDVTEEFCRAGEVLTAKAGLDDRVSFRQGSALEMPYPNATLELGWTQHSSMNIPDKERLYAEIQRMLSPGGRLALHEILAGPLSPIHLPVPWARDPALSHLLPPCKFASSSKTQVLRSWPGSTRAPPPCNGTSGDPQRRPENRHRSAPTSCSAMTSARCPTTRCST